MEAFLTGNLNGHKAFHTPKYNFVSKYIKRSGCKSESHFEFHQIEMYDSKKKSRIIMYEMF